MLVLVIQRHLQLHSQVVVELGSLLLVQLILQRMVLLDLLLMILVLDMELHQQ